MKFLKNSLFSLIFQISTLFGQFLSTSGMDIVDPSGNPFILKGMGLGGWLVPEGYMLLTGGSPTDIRNKFIDLIGEDSTAAIMKRYEENYVGEKDIEQLAKWGFNSVRVPFHYKSISPNFGEYDPKGFATLDSVIKWCSKHEIYAILDMHVAPGSQSGDANADSDGEARLWTSKLNQDWSVDIWGEIARRYQSEIWVGGYDLLNEPVHSNGRQVRELQKIMAEKIREFDKNHILFVNGNYWSRAFEDLVPKFDDNMVWAFHYYSWMVNTSVSKNTIQYLIDLRKNTNTPLWLGECGENSNEWFVQLRTLIENNNIGWAWWNYKKIGTINAPVSSPTDPIYQEILNYWGGSGSKPNFDRSLLGLSNMVENLKFENCELKEDVVASLLSKDFQVKNLPFKSHFIPGVIQLADYDLGSLGVAYYDRDYIDDRSDGGSFKAWNKGYQYRNDGVDIEKNSDQYYISHTENGEFLRYTINIIKSDLYDFSITSSSASIESEITVKLGNESIFQKVTLPATGQYGIWKDHAIGQLSLKKGVSTLTLIINRGGANIRSFQITSQSSRDGDVILSHKLYPNPVSETINFQFEALTSKKVSFDIYNILGQQVWSGSYISQSGFNNFTIQPMGNGRKYLPSGLYFLIANDGQKILKEKFIMLNKD